MAKENDEAEATGKRPQFGNRYLTEDEDVYKHNAWDDVEWDTDQEQEAIKMVKKNSEVRLAREKVHELELNASGNWDKFYLIHANRFFKDRNWLFTEFPELLRPDGGVKDDDEEGSGSGVTPLVALEVGCGVGNTIFPLLETNNHPDTRVYACDFSSTAVQLVKENPDYQKNGGRCQAFVCDITKPEDWANSAPFAENSLDAVTMLFVLSAIDPNQLMDSAVSSVFKYLKPGGVVFLRDYGRYDLAQLRLKPGKCLTDNFYARGDGTLCYFFQEEELVSLFTRNGFEKVQSRVDRRLQINRGKKLKMYRVWIQAKFRKPL